MDETHLSVYHSALNHARGKGLRNSRLSLTRIGTLSTHFFCQETVQYSRYMMTKLKLKHPGVSGPYAAGVFCV